MLLKGKSTLGKTIICLQNGQQMGKVKGIIIDPTAVKVAALFLESKAIFKEKIFVPYDKVHSIEEVVTVKYTNCTEKPHSSSHLGQLFRNRTSIYGAKIITESGTILGTVDDFLFDTTTGQIEHLIIAEKFHDKLFMRTSQLTVSYIVTIGDDAIIAKADAKDALCEVSGNISEKVESIKDSSKKIWSTTKGTTLKWVKSLSHSKENEAEKNLSTPKENNESLHPCCLDPDHEQNKTEKKD